MSLEEEGESLPQADDEGEACQEQQLWGRERSMSTNTARPGATGRHGAGRANSSKRDDIREGGDPAMWQNPRALNNLSWLGTELPRGWGLDKENFEGL